MTNDLEIGVSDLEGNGHVSFGQWFRLEANKDNPYRVLPPLFSNASTGRWSQYYATHTVWVTLLTGKRKPFHFECIEEKNKQGQIIRDCPFCMKARENEAKYKVYKEKVNQDDENEKKKLREFLQRHVWSLSANKRMYVNVVNLENAAGVLELPYKSFNALKAKLIEVRKNTGKDATGNPGMFLNFKKTQAYKGDRDTAYSVEQYLEHGVDENGQPIARFKSHVLNDAAINSVKNGCKDLSLLFKSISSTEMEQILSVMSSNEDLTQLCERLFAQPEAVISKNEDPSSGAVYVSKTEMVDGDIKKQTNLNSSASDDLFMVDNSESPQNNLQTPSTPLNDSLDDQMLSGKPNISKPDTIDTFSDSDFADFFGVN